MVNSVLLVKRTLCVLLSLTVLVSYLKKADNKNRSNVIPQAITDFSDEKQRILTSSTSEFRDSIPSSSLSSTTPSSTTVKRKPTLYATLSVDTPNGDTYRGYDYAFALPLDALAWERVGFRTVVTIVGARCQWENDPALRVILNYLEDRNSLVIFMESKKEYRSMLAQTSRIFLPNFDEFPGHPDDFIMTADSDQWPLLRELFQPIPDKPNVLLSLHPWCFHVFNYSGHPYQMLPMMNIGATVSTWKQILNDNRKILAKDAESIMSYYEDAYGPEVRIPVKFGSDGWYWDQLLLGVRVGQWREKYGNDSVVRPDDGNYTRLDRSSWNPEEQVATELDLKYDAHLPSKIYLKERWDSLRNLINYMYGENSTLSLWCEKYFTDFYSKIRNYVNFNDIPK